MRNSVRFAKLGRVRHWCWIVMLFLAMTLGMVSGCGGQHRVPDIVVTGFAQYDWVRNVLGENPAGFEVKYLLDNGVDLHNYLPSVQDKAAISTAKLFVYTDSDAEKWISSALQNPKNEDRKTLNLISLLSKDEKIALDEDSGHVHDETCEHEYDEHVWLSLRLAQKFVTAIADRLCVIDPQNGEIYQSNAQSYKDKLVQLDKQYEQAIDSSIQKKLLVADRYPFAYLMRDYGIEVAAAFSGCAADTEILVQKMTELKAYLVQNDLGYVVILENSPDRIAKQIISGTSAQIRVLSSMQSVTAGELDEGYLSVMQANLKVLSEVLSASGGDAWH